MTHLRSAAAAALALSLAAGSGVRAEEVDLAATLDQCRPDVARATTDELVAAAQAAGWTDFEKGEIGQLPVMASSKVVDPEARRPTTVSLGVLGVNGGGTWAFVCAVETKPASAREVRAWTRSVYPDADDIGWAGTLTDGKMVGEDREELVENLGERLGALPSGQRIVMFSVTGGRKTSTVTTQVFEKID